MWAVTIGLTIFFWLVLDNILVGVMLAIFTVFLFSTTKALLLVRQEQKKAQAKAFLVNTNEHHDLVPVSDGVKREQAVGQKMEQGIEKKVGQDIDESYLSLLDDDYNVAKKPSDGKASQ